MRRLTPAQIEEYRKKNLCSKCDEPFTFGHKCKNRSIMLIESEELEGNVVEEEDDDEEEEEEPQGQRGAKEPEISLHAMEGSLSLKTIRLLRQVNRKPVSILLDTGSTHNFIYPKAIQRTGLQVPQNRHSM